MPDPATGAIRSRHGASGHPSHPEPKGVISHDRNGMTGAGDLTPCHAMGMSSLSIVFYLVSGGKSEATATPWPGRANEKRDDP